MDLDLQLIEARNEASMIDPGKLRAAKLLIHGFGARVVSLNHQTVLAVPHVNPTTVREFNNAVDVLGMEEMPIVAGHSFLESAFRHTQY